MFGQTGNPLSRFYKLGAGFVRFFRSPRDPRYRDTLQSFLAHRESNFLSVVQKVLAKTGHPYAQLFGIAGCSYADLEAGVRENGLESTLEALLREGVYLSLDEFRGKAEIVRGGRHIAATTADWDLARGQNAIEATSSGSSGGRTFRTSHGLEVANLGLASARLFLGEVMRRDAAIVTVAPILPSTLGLLSCIGSIRLGYRDEKWFAFGGSLLANGHYRAITSVIVSALRAAGAKVPYPTYLTKDDFSPAAEYVAARKKQGVPIALHGMVSAAARVAGAAIDRGLDVRGTVAVVTGETLTDSKRELIESAGIEVFPIYTTSDFGQIGVPCHEMNSGDCVHIAMPSVALVARPAPSLWGDGELLNSLHVTSVLPFAPRVLINVEMGDTGIIELATCDCEFSRLGYKLRV
ncbi:MAG: hypothetical protein LAO79_29585, partial [Acidobacteriia bacterium]|nr:hypothetical protein [Terriglobia bacterium]